jgi:hypothetical protein
MSEPKGNVSSGVCNLNNFDFFDDNIPRTRETDETAANPMLLLKVDSSPCKSKTLQTVILLVFFFPKNAVPQLRFLHWSQALEQISHHCCVENRQCDSADNKDSHELCSRDPNPLQRPDKWMWPVALTGFF